MIRTIIIDVAFVILVLAIALLLAVALVASYDADKRDSEKRP